MPYLDDLSVLAPEGVGPMNLNVKGGAPGPGANVPAAGVRPQELDGRHRGAGRPTDALRYTLHRRRIARRGDAAWNGCAGVAPDPRVVKRPRQDLASIFVCWWEPVT